MYIEERHIVHVKDRSSIGVGFPKSNMGNMDVINYDAETWMFKSQDFILKKHIVYDKTNDTLVVLYPDTFKRWKIHGWEIPVERLLKEWSAAAAFKKISARPWGTEHVIGAIREALTKVLTGNLEGLRVVEGVSGNYAYRH